MDKSRRHSVVSLVKKGERALRKLRERHPTSAKLIADAYIGMQALDEQQAMLRQGLDDLVVEYVANENAPLSGDERELLKSLRQHAKHGARQVTVVTEKPSESPSAPPVTP